MGFILHKKGFADIKVERDERKSPVPSKKKTEAPALPTCLSGGLHLPDPWRPEEDLENATLPHHAGVYALLEADRVVYVGQSGDIPRRLQEHRKEGKKTWDSVYWISCMGGSDRLRLEGMLILAYVPRYNKAVVLGLTNDGRVYDLNYALVSRRRKRIPSAP